MHAIYLTNDLLFSSRVSSSAKSHGGTLVVVGSRQRLDEELAKLTADWLVVDLEHPAADPAELKRAVADLTPAPRLVAYGPHVKETLLARAQQAGFDLVLSRGQFDKQHALLFQTPSADT